MCVRPWGVCDAAILSVLVSGAGSSVRPNRFAESKRPGRFIWARISNYNVRKEQVIGDGESCQQLKMTQQLVMTPQLQQAIKLLQMTRIELQDVGSPGIGGESDSGESSELEEVREGETLLEVVEAELPDEALTSPDSFQEVEAGEETLRDWDSYLDGYNYTSGEQSGDTMTALL